MAAKRIDEGGVAPGEKYDGTSWVKWRPKTLAKEQLKFTYVAPSSELLTHYGRILRIPVVPPVQLDEGDRLELWIVLGSEGVRYEHAGSGRE